MKNPKLIGLIAIIVFILTLSSGLIVNPAKASSIQFSEAQITSNPSPSAQENPDIYSSGSNDYAIVWQDNRNGNWDIYKFSQAYLGNGNWSVYPEVRITANSGNNTNPKVYDNTIVYQSDRNGNWDIYIYAPQLNSLQPEIRVTTNPANEINPRIYNDNIVYQSDRNGNWDIYIYNITSKVETQITNDTAIQSDPAIYGNTVVWQDARNAVWDEHYQDYNPWNIYTYNLTTHTEQRLSRQNEDSFSPAISGDRIAYMKEVFWNSGYSGIYSYRYYYTPYVCSYELSTGRETDVTRGNQTLNFMPSAIKSPAIDGTLVAWMEQGVDWNIAVRDALTGAGRESAGGNQMNPAISGNHIVYQDDRNGNWDIYLTLFWYGVGATGPSNQSTPGPSLGNTVKSDNQQLATIMIGATTAVVIVVVGVATFMAMKRRNSVKPNK